MGGNMEALIDSGFKVKIAFNLFLSKMRPIFCGNFEHDARQSELECLFGRYGKVDRVDMKSDKFIPF
ncbi:Arginine serine-rich-splicing factor [Musa troglodytarum]|uniref:Arginine serine-rich-splicing factor n=1 Tax=Musa troglodytarum TaxID=320322 RepID=A0A9E7JBN1_9LILI|nr:Arginine serine-rich-splicing factor [Musa troglodytarum]